MFIQLLVFCHLFLSVFGQENIIRTTINQESGKNRKALSVFQVVRFPNIGCVGDSNLNGTCYTSSECKNKGGVDSGSCASGFGVCCTFKLNCGGSSAENCTYFESSSNQPAGQCSVQICESSSDICQLRLDFTTFVINGPSTISDAQVFILNGAALPSIAAGTSSKAASLATQCLTDVFTITANGKSPPVICGTNTNYHMYVDSSDNCNTLTFQLGSSGIGTNLIPSRSWNIKISQISCMSLWMAPQGCTQYYTGLSGTIYSYNFAGGTQLANQQQQMCFRRERGYCTFCVTPSTITSTDFSISGASGGNGLDAEQCCGYGVDGMNTNGFDCLVIPGAIRKLANTIVPNHFCGGFLLASGIAANGGTICTSQTPFNILFLTDAYTFIPATGMANKAGFRLMWSQTACTTN